MEMSSSNDLNIENGLIINCININIELFMMIITHCDLFSIF